VSDCDRFEEIEKRVKALEDRWATADLIAKIFAERLKATREMWEAAEK